MTIFCKHCQSSDVERRGFSGDGDTLKQRCKCNNCDKWFRVDVEYEVTATFERTEKELKKLLKNERFIITCAQNNTPIDKKVWGAIKSWAKHFKAQIIVIPVLYKVRNALGELEKEAWWPPEVEPYLIQNEIKLAPGIRVFGDLKISATNVNPLAGLEIISQGDSAIIGHPQIQMKTVPTPQQKLPKILLTTGSVTIKNYADSGPGKKGDFNHSSGAAIVELDREFFHIRSVVGDSKGEFYDLDLHCTSRGVKKIKSIPGIVLGDEHEWFNSPEVREATFDAPDSVIKTLKPKLIIRHDVTDSYSITHHHKNSPSIKYSKHFNNMDSLEMELESTVRFLEETTPKGSTSVVVPSNHHNHIKRWLEEIDWRTEPWNARIYMELWGAWLDAIDHNFDFHPFTWWMKKNCKADVLYLVDDYPFIIKGVYVGYHGDRGPNGAKGSITSFAKIGVKTIIGHLHTPGINKGCYQVGTSSELNLEYTSGPSSWLQTHCLIFPNSKRQLVNIVGGKWRK